jgi:hypothetical protein
MNTTSLQYLKFEANLERLWARTPGMAPVGHAVHVGMVESLGIMQQGKIFEDFPEPQPDAHATGAPEPAA